MMIREFSTIESESGVSKSGAISYTESRLVLLNHRHSNDTRDAILGSLLNTSNSEKAKQLNPLFCLLTLAELFSLYHLIWRISAQCQNINYTRLGSMDSWGCAANKYFFCWCSGTDCVLLGRVSEVCMQRDMSVVGGGECCSNDVGVKQNIFAYFRCKSCCHQEMGLRYEVSCADRLRAL